MGIVAKPVSVLGRAHPKSSAAPRVVKSDALFGGAYELRILHGGAEYRLRRTKQEKLILTK
jgi:hemin uptake protein HemP